MLILCVGTDARELGALRPSRTHPYRSNSNVRRGDSMGEVIVDGVKFVFDESGTKLVKKSLAEAQGAASTPLHTSINGEAYIRTKNGNLISQSLVRERRARAKGKQPAAPSSELCTYYTRTGVCRRGPSCPFVHDSEKRAICPGTLKASGCTQPPGSCLLSHTPSPHRTPHCVHFLAGHCRYDEACRFLHVKGLDLEASPCRQFARLGWCDAGADCPHKHTWECPDFAEKGICTTKGCRLSHSVRAPEDTARPEPTPDTLFVRDDSGADERYFVEDAEPAPDTLAGDDNARAFAQQRDYISLDDGVDAVSVSSDSELEDTGGEQESDDASEAAADAAEVDESLGLSQ